jgi:flagellar hook-associated protein 2
MSNISISNLYTNGVNFSGLIQALVAVQAQPINEINQELQTLTERQSIWQTVSTQLAQVGTDANNLLQASTWNQVQATSSNTAVMTAAVDSSASPGTYNITVTQLAQAEIDASSAQSSSTSSLGISGSFTINGSAAITISSSDSLDDIAQAINATAGTGVTATVINNQLIIQADNTDQPIVYDQTSGTPLTQLGVITSSGTNNAIQNPAPLQYNFSFTNSSTGTTTTITEQQPTNTDSTTLPGVTMQFSGVGSTTLTITPNVQAVASSVGQLVNDFNTLVQTLNSNTGKGDPMQGSVSMNTLSGQLAQVVTTQVASLAGQPYEDLQDIGITLNQDGTLSVNQSQLTTAIESNPADVEQIFQDAAQGIATQLQTLSQQYTAASTGLIASITEGYQQEINLENSQLASLQQQLQVYQQQLQQEFLAAQEMIAKLDGTSTFLSQVGAATSALGGSNTTSSATGSTGTTSTGG